MRTVESTLPWFLDVAGVLAAILVAVMLRRHSFELLQASTLGRKSLRAR